MRLKSVFSVRALILLTILAGLSVAVLCVLPGEALARSTFQSPLSPTATHSPTPTATTLRTITPSVLPTQSITATSPSAITPTALSTPRTPPAIAPASLPEPKAPGFLPPPTLQAPRTKVPSAPGPAAPLAAAPALAPTPEDAASPLARLIDTGIAALSYLWLCCGVLVVAGVTLVLAWLMRRGRRTAPS